MIHSELRVNNNYKNTLAWRSYEHFRQRLNERYEIDICLAKYFLLCRERIDAIYHEKNCVVGWIEINGVMVLVSRQVKKDRLLKTALPNDWDSEGRKRKMAKKELTHP